MPSFRNAQILAALNGLVDSCDLGSGVAAAHLKIYSGSVPTNVETALSGNTLLADLTMANPAFLNSADTNPGGSVTADAISDDTSADASGTATFARIVDRDGTARIQLTVSAAGGGGECTINSASILAGATVRCSGITLTMPE